MGLAATTLYIGTSIRSTAAARGSGTAAAKATATGSPLRRSAMTPASVRHLKVSSYNTINFSVPYFLRNMLYT